MPRTYEVIPSSYGTGRRQFRSTYVTCFIRAEQARRQAEARLDHERNEEVRRQELDRRTEARLALERSGELRRQELEWQAYELQHELRVFARQLARIGQDDRILDAALRRLPQDAPALERWIAEASVLREGVAQAMPELISASERREREGQAEAERRQRDEEDWLAYGVQLTASMLRNGTYLPSDDINRALEDAACLESQYESSIPEHELDELEKALERASRIEEMLDWYDRDQHPFVTPRLTKVERDTLELRKYHRGTGKRHRRGLDPDKRRKWRKEVASMAA